MPRTARVKSEDSIYHIMIRGVGDIKLYKNNEDKDKYLELIGRYQVKFGFKVYAYCLMDTHGHIIVDSFGGDISKIMHGINQCYAQYYNRKYKRCGHVFGDRFKSKIVRNDKYLLTLSAYIHNNPKDLVKWSKNPSKYPYSSLGIYLGLRKEKLKILDESYILEFFNKTLKISREKYKIFMSKNDDVILMDEVEFKNVKTEYRSERVIIVRNYTPNQVIDYVSKYTMIDPKKVTMKYTRESMESKALSVLLMRRFCNFTIRDICESLGNITQSRVSKLCNLGLKIVCSDERYSGIMEDFINLKSA